MQKNKILLDGIPKLGYCLYEQEYFLKVLQYARFLEGRRVFKNVRIQLFSYRCFLLSPVSVIASHVLSGSFTFPGEIGVAPLLRA